MKGGISWSEHSWILKNDFKLFLRLPCIFVWLLFLCFYLTEWKLVYIKTKMPFVTNNCKSNNSDICDCWRILVVVRKLRPGERYEVWNCSLKIVLPSNAYTFLLLCLTTLFMDYRQFSWLFCKYSMRGKFPFSAPAWCVSNITTLWCQTMSYAVGMMEKSLKGTILEI